MRIVIIDLHNNAFFVCNMKSVLNNLVTISKHKYFIEEAINRDYEVIDYISGTNSQLWLGKQSRFLNVLVAKYILKKNGLKKDKIKVTTNVDDLKEDDIVIFYPHLDDCIDLEKIPGRKYANLNHFFNLRSAGKVPFTDFLKPDYFEGYICEANVLKNSTYFRRYFPTQNKRLLLLPYVAEERFKNERDWYSRNNKCLALGVAGIEVKELKDVYGTSFLHPMRTILYEKRNINTDIIDCKIVEFDKHVSRQLVRINQRDNKVVRIIKRIINHFYCNRQSQFRKNGKNGAYYAVDRVAQLNSYKMFIYPEEISGIPALGFVEGMSCGCAYIGLRHSMYMDLGLEPGKHYIAYDGTYEDLIEKVKYYLKHDEELRKIAITGYRYVTEKLNRKAAFDWMMKQLYEKED